MVLSFVALDIIANEQYFFVTFAVILTSTVEFRK